MYKLIEKALSESIDQLLRADEYLLLSDANERTISHRLAIYIESHFLGWNVDCEYNRDGFEPKYLSLKKDTISTYDTSAKTVYPDIIVHKRGTKDNLLVIEMKKTTSSVGDEHDIDKLKAFKKELGYKYAVFIKFKTDGQVGVEEPIWI